MAIGTWIAGKAGAETHPELVKKAQRRLQQAARDLNQPHSVNSILDAQRRLRQAQEDLDSLNRGNPPSGASQ